MPYFVIAGAAILIELLSLVAISVSFAFVPAPVRIAGPLLIAIVGLFRGEGRRRVTEVLVGVLLLMVLNPGVFGGVRNAATASIAVAAVVFLAASGISSNDREPPGALALAWSGLLMVLVLFVLLAGAVLTLGLVHGIEAPLR